jgi:hypothetical protein
MRLRAREDPADIQIHVYVLLLKNASVRNARLVLPVSSRPRTATEPPPTFPFLESQCQRAALRHELLLYRRSKAARKVGAQRAAAERVYREVAPACQTGKSEDSRLSCRALVGPLNPLPPRLFWAAVRALLIPGDFRVTSAGLRKDTKYRAPARLGVTAAIIRSAENRA